MNQTEMIKLELQMFFNFIPKEHYLCFLSYIA